MGLNSVVCLLCDSVKSLQTTAATSSVPLSHLESSDVFRTTTKRSGLLPTNPSNKSNLRGGGNTKLHFQLVLPESDGRRQICDNNCSEIHCHRITCDESSGSSSSSCSSGKGGGIDRKKSAIGPIEGLRNNCTKAIGVSHLNYLTSALCVSTLLASVNSEMDLLRTPSGLRKKSSLLWNSLRLPRKQKGEYRYALHS